MKLVSLTDIRAAADTLRAVAHHTPVLTSAAFDAACGRTVCFKAEHLQRAGAFKFRGAYHRIAAIPAAERGRGVTAFSSGNHAQAVALAARLFGIPSTICMPTDAPDVKREATRGYGATVIGYDRAREDRVAFGRRVAAERGQTLVPPFDDPWIIAGAGTVAWELLAEAPDIDVLVVPVGGGGLISGCAVAAKGSQPGIRVIGVETEGADDARQSLRAGRRIAIPPPDTIADGIRTTELGTVTWPHVQALVDDIVVVSDTEVLAAMRFLALRLKQVIEPTGAVAAAAVLAGRLGPSGQGTGRVGVILSGGNADPALLAQALTG